jgi:hypothetical protein
MSTLERYKKKGGFIQILTLIESSEPAKAEKFLSLIAQESQAWAEAIKEKSLTIHKIKDLDKTAQFEALERIPATVLANGLIKEAAEVRESIFSNLSQTLQKKIELAMNENPDPRPGDILACQLRIIASTRAAITEGRIKQSQLPKELQIPENIETSLSKVTWSQTLRDIVSAKTDEPPPPTPSLQASPQVTNTSSNLNNSGGGDVLELKRRIQTLTEENQGLKNQVIELQNKINQVKNILG